MRVYLSGPITGQSPAQVRDWRDVMREKCQNIEFIDPAQAAIDTRNAYAKPESDKQALERLHHGRFVLDRNRTLIENSDLVFANFLNSESRVSIGSVGELFWANAFGKPIIIVRQKTGNIHNHAMLNALASRVCFSLEDGWNTLNSFECDQLRIA